MAGTLSSRPVAAGIQARWWARPAAHLGWLAASTTWAYVAIAGVYLWWQLQPTRLLGYEYLSDEGVYVQTGWAVLRGERLFTDVFSSQGPLIPYLFAGTFALVGPSMAAARVAVVVLSLFGLIGVGLLAARRAAWAGVAAAAMLAFDPVFGFNALLAQPGADATALAALAVGLASHSSVRADRRIWWLAAIVFALATLAKLTALVVAPPLALLLLAQFRRSGLRRVVTDAAAFATPTVIVWVVVLGLGGPAQVLDQLVGFRAAASHTYPLVLADNVGLLTELVSNNPFPWLVAAGGCLALGMARRWLLLSVCVVWLLAAFASLLAYTPLFPHHLVVLFPPLTVLGGVGLYQALAGSIRLIQRVERPNLVGQALVVTIIVAAMVTLPQTETVRSGAVRDLAKTPKPAPADAIAAVQAAVPPGKVLVTDDQLIATAAQRRVPAALVDTSEVRVKSGYLSLATFVAAVERDRPAAILLWSNQLDLVPGLRKWVEDHYQHQTRFSKGRDLYVRADPT